jgi:multidrug efflux pump subunit AcrA (membrane-fusion protein)
VRRRRILTGGSVSLLALVTACGTDQASFQQAPPNPPTVPTSIASSAPAPAASACSEPGLGGYDLVDYAVEETADTIVLTATVQPIDPGHDVVITFTSPNSSKRVAGELFEDGSGVAQIQDVASLDTVYLEGPHDFATDHMRLVVARQLVDSGLIAGAMTVELKVDGASVEACTSTSS